MTNFHPKFKTKNSHHFKHNNKNKFIVKHKNKKKFNPVNVDEKLYCFNCKKNIPSIKITSIDFFVKP